MPKLSLAMESGTIVSWLKKVGDRVEIGEAIIEIETDKVVEEVTSEVAGVLIEVIASDGDVVPVSQTIGFMEVPTTVGLGDGSTSTNGSSENALDALIAASRAGSSASTPVTFPGFQPDVTDVSRGRAGGKRITVSHRASALARTRGIDLAELPKGRGPGGRIVEKDVLEWASRREPSSETTPAVVELTPAQQIMASRMATSFSEVPHFYLTVEASADRLSELRQQMISTMVGPSQSHVSISDLILKAAAVALRQNDAMRVYWMGGNIHRDSQINIGIAVDVPDALIVPVIKDVDQKSIAQIARDRADLVARARTRKLTRDDVSGGTFTITNLGMFGVDQFQAIINPPQSAILAVGRIKERPVVEGGVVMSRPTVHLTLSVDHRVVTGAQAARFLADMVAVIEDPARLSEGV